MNGRVDHSVVRSVTTAGTADAFNDWWQSLNAYDTSAKSPIHLHGSFCTMWQVLGLCYLLKPVAVIQPNNIQADQIVTGIRNAAALNPTQGCFEIFHSRHKLQSTKWGYTASNQAYIAGYRASLAHTLVLGTRQLNIYVCNAHNGKQNAWVTLVNLHTSHMCLQITC